MFAVSLSRTIFIIILILLTFLLVKMFSEMRKIQDNWDEYMYGWTECYGNGQWVQSNNGVLIAEGDEFNRIRFTSN